MKPIPKPARERFTITLEVSPGRVPAVVRLRKFLKLAQRAFALRCVAIEPAVDVDEGRPKKFGPRPVKR